MTTKRRGERRRLHRNTDSAKIDINLPLSDGHVGTKEVAAKLGVEPHHLRVVLRSMGKGARGERYVWKQDDPFLHKIAKAVKSISRPQKSRRANLH